VAKKEIVRLQTEHSIEAEKSNNYYEMYQNLALEKERREASMSSELNQLKNQLGYLISEKDQLSRMLKVQNTNNEQMASKYFCNNYRYS